LLDEDEIDLSEVVCNGIDGLDTRVQFTLIEPNELCATGGVLIESWTDTDGNGVLDTG
jgi:hypothetical protein